MSNTSIYTIRDEYPGDTVAISTITETAFKDLAYGDQREHVIVENLRKTGQLTMSLVAVCDEIVVGHVGFSPITIDSKHAGWFGLGPLSVLPSRQRQGIGSALVQEGLSRLKELGGKGCCLIGDPAYYRRFGFASNSELTCDGIPTENVMALAFHKETLPSGKLEFDQSFWTS